MIAAWSAYSSLLMRAPVDVEQTSPRAPDRGGSGNVCTGGTKGYVDGKQFDQMAGELKA
jgi:hypothetical protein